MGNGGRIELHEKQLILEEKTTEIESLKKRNLQLQAEVAKRKRIIPCEHCGRILVDNDILNA